MTNNKDSVVIVLALVVGAVIGYMMGGVQSSVPEEARVVKSSPSSKTYAVTDYYPTFVEKVRSSPDGYAASREESSNVFVGWAPSSTDLTWSVTCTADWNGAVVGHAWLLFTFDPPAHWYYVNAWGNYTGGFGVTCTAQTFF